jgi:Protein of unknown function (DUF3489)
MTDITNPVSSPVQDADLKTESTKSVASSVEREPAKAQAPTKSFAVQKLLSRTKGASITEIMTATGWQPHSARAFLTGLRKKNITIVRECRKDGETSYRIAS